MSLRLALARRALPMSLRRHLLNELAAATAEGFGSPLPTWTGRAFDARLTDYARFTAEQTQTLLTEGDVAALEAAMVCLRQRAMALGARSRRWFGVKSATDALEALTILYRAVGIEASRVAPGAICVHRCLFAGYYSESVCRVMVALDEGIAAGLSAGGRLRFDERMTAGASCCSAHLAGGALP